MRLGILSDIHGNPWALAVALRLLASADQLLFLGDLVGYYPWPLQCLEMLERERVTWVLGNHDFVFLRAMEAGHLPSDYAQRYGRALEDLIADRRSADILAERLSRSSMAHRASIDGMQILAVHGSPDDALSARVYPDTPVEWAESACADVVLLGHTHHAMDRRIDGCRVVNPGSVGQARDRSGEVSVAILETEGRTVDLLRERYDVTPVLAWSRDTHPDLPYIAEVLVR